MRRRSLFARDRDVEIAVELSEPLVWPVATKRQPDIPSFAGHTDTVPDVVGRIGTPLSLVIFTEGNQLMVSLSEEIVGSFPSWAKSQAQYADINTDNIVVVTLPRANLVQMVRSGGIGLGNLTLDVSRAFGIYPDVVIGGPTRLQDCVSSEFLSPSPGLSQKIAGPLCLFAKETHTE
jgi:hypothetical protein